MGALVKSVEKKINGPLELDLNRPCEEGIQNNTETETGFVVLITESELTKVEGVG